MPDLSILTLRTVRHFLLLVLGCCSVGAHASASCDDGASDACFFAFTLPGSQDQMHYYASEDPLAPRNAAGPTEVLIAMHGHSHDANKTFDAALLALEHANAKGRVLVIAPVYPADSQQARKCSTAGVPGPTDHDLVWSCSSWQENAPASNGGHQTSFAVMDALVADLKQHWPELRRVTLAGFSAGAQMVQHYVAFAAPAPAGTKMRFVVSDPGTWLYFDPVRPIPVKNGNPADWADCVSDGALANTCALALSNQFAESCPGFNQWKYGTAGLPGDLTRDADEARHQYAAADISYLEGALDDSGGKGTSYRVLDRSCGAESQGPFRLQRGVGYAYYDKTQLSKEGRHALTIVPGCAHDVACVFPSDAARASLLGPNP